MSVIKVALIQPHWKTSPEKNLEYIISRIHKIGRNRNTDIICLPEFFMGPPWYFPGQSHYKGVVDDTVPGRITDTLGRLAKEYKVYILCGTIIERQGRDYFNSSIALDSNGEIIGKARKIHCFAAELSSIKPGTDRVVLDTPFATIGICVCSDFWISEIPRMMAIEGAEIIYISGASLLQNIDILRPCLVANSVNNVCYTLYTSLVGKVTGQRSDKKPFSIELGGHTTVASPNGIVSTLADEDSILYADIDIEYLRNIRKVDPKFKNTHFWCLWGRKPELYGDILKPYKGAKDSLESLLSDFLP